jgi:pimeloyl-ACP methyl ester carboxylesterase
MAANERVVRSADGLGLFVRDFAPEAPILGAPVLCLHGLTRNLKDFEAVAPRIAAIGRRAIAMDVRGRGRSDWDGEPKRYRPSVYAEDALRVLDALGVEKAVWLGTSMGGLVSMNAAARAPDRVLAVVLNDVGTRIEAAGVQRILSYLGKIVPCADWEEAAQQVRASNAAAYPDADDAFWQAMAARLYRRTARGTYEPDYDPSIAQGGAPDEPLPAALFPHLRRIPTLVLRGALSDILSRTILEEMLAVKPDLDIAEVPNVGHAPTLEEPSAWLPIVDFLARQP